MSPQSTSRHRETYVSPSLPFSEAAKIYSILHSHAEATRRRSNQSGSSRSSMAAASAPREETSTADVGAEAPATSEPVDVEAPAPSEPSPAEPSPAAPETSAPSTVRLVEADPPNILDPSVAVRDFATPSADDPPPYSATPALHTERTLSPPTWPATAAAAEPLANLSYPANEAQPVRPETFTRSVTCPRIRETISRSETVVRRSETFSRVSQTVSRASDTVTRPCTSSGGSMLRVTVSAMSVAEGPSCARPSCAAPVPSDVERVRRYESGYYEGEVAEHDVRKNGENGEIGQGCALEGGAEVKQGDGAVKEGRRRSWTLLLSKLWVGRRKKEVKGKEDKGKGKAVEPWMIGVEEERARNAEMEEVRVKAVEAELEREREGRRRMEMGRAAVVVNQ